MTRRRTLICGAVGGVLAAPFARHAESADKVYRLGYLSTGQSYAEWTHRDIFVASMRERGWIEGRNFTVDSRWAQGHSERLGAMAAELVRQEVDLIFCAGSPVVTAAKSAPATVPIVFFYIGDPVRSGFVASLARPGGNVTGMGGLGKDLHAKQLELLTEVAPRATRVALFVNPAIPFHNAALAEVEATARNRGVVLRAVELRSPDDIEAACASAARERADALHVFGQGFLFAQGARVARLAVEQRLPAVIPFEEVAKAGLLMSYAGRSVDDVRRLPYFIDRILKGAKPAELPVEQPTRFYLTLNLKTAKAIGLTVPQSLLLRADEVIE